MTKNEARNTINQYFINLPKKEKSILESKIFNNFKKYIDTTKYKSIGSYFSLKNEVETSSLNNFLAEKGINIYFPKISEKKNYRKLIFFKNLKDDKLAKNRFGVLETSRNEETIDVRDLDLIIIPLRAVNKNLIRLGYGGGFYDFSLSKISSCKCLGLGFDFQIIQNFDVEIHDKKLGGLITPSNYFKNAL